MIRYFICRLSVFDINLSPVSWINVRTRTSIRNVQMCECEHLPCEIITWLIQGRSNLAFLWTSRHGLNSLEFIGCLKNGNTVLYCTPWAKHHIDVEPPPDADYLSEIRVFAFYKNSYFTHIMWVGWGLCNKVWICTIPNWCLQRWSWQW